jgi:hypothetical protein
MLITEYTLHRTTDLLTQKKINQNTQNAQTLVLKKNQPTNTQNHKAYVKKKQRLTEKRNYTWCELGHDSRSGVKEGGTSLLDLDSGVKKNQPTNTQNHKAYVKKK